MMKKLLFTLALVLQSCAQHSYAQTLRKPIVLNAGKMQQAQAGDRLVDGTGVPFLTTNDVLPTAQPNQPIDVSTYMTGAQIADVIAGTKLLDVTTPVQNWLAACVAQHRPCRAMAGTYKISGQIVFEQAGNLTTGLTVYSEAPGSTIFDSSYTGGAPFILQASGGTVPAPISSTYAYLSGIAFRCNYAGPCLTIGKPDFSDQINEYTIWRVTVQNFNTTASSTSFEFNSTYSGNVYANGSTGASPGQILTRGAITGGSGYTNGTYTNVNLCYGSGSTCLGSGQGALGTATITVSGGAVTAVTITSGGVLYNVGDVLSAPTASIGGTGSGFSFPVATVSTVQNDIFRLRQTSFTSFKIGGSSGWNFMRLRDNFNYGNTFVAPDCEIVATCFKIDSGTPVKNTTIGGTYAYSNFGFGIDASAGGDFLAINPNINAIVGNFLSGGSGTYAARWGKDTLATLASPTFTGTPGFTNGTDIANVYEDGGGNFQLANSKSGAFTVISQAGTGTIQLKVNNVATANLTAGGSRFTTSVGTGGYTVATLPAAQDGDRAFVTDATACTFMAAVTGGGATKCPVVYLSGWKAGG